MKLRQVPVWMLGVCTLLLATPVVADPLQDCRAFLGQKFGPAQVLGATLIPEAAPAPQGLTSIRVQKTYCAVEGRIVAERGSEIGFEIWLPVGKDWNGRLLALGSGASLGSFDYSGLSRGVIRGFATASTDDGHKQQRGSNNTWAFERPARVRDFGGRAQHLTTVAAKSIIQAFYGKAAQYSYFSGYSRGGAAALMMAQRYPDDFDGILGGAPPYSWAQEMVMQAWILKALTRTPASALNTAEFAALNSAVLRACAGPDGLIADPRDCSFDPASLQCPATGSGFCLKKEQIEAVRDIYRGPHDSHGRPITRGLTRGSEAAWAKLWDVNSLGIDNAGGSWLGVWRYLVFDDPAWTLDRIDFDRDPAIAERRIGQLLTQNNPDLAPFARHGGRMILYHGWGDDMAPAEPSVDYHAAVVAKMGPEAARQVLRLFMVPGIDHARNGPGAGGLLNTERAAAVPREPGRDLLATLQHWVENGAAPDRFVASKLDDQGRIVRTRLLCPEPRMARYSGQGDVGAAENWTCVNR